MHWLLKIAGWIITTLFKLAVLAFAFVCKIVGMILLKTGETIEKIYGK